MLVAEARRTQLVFALLFTAACGATNSGMRFDVAPPAEQAEVSPARASSPEVGVVDLISDAIANLTLTPDQNRKLNALVSEIGARHERVQDARKALSLEMASEVATGAIDERALLADAEALGKARAEIDPEEGKSLERLHRILTPEQRKQFAAAMTARADKLPIDDAETRYGNWRADLNIGLMQNDRIQPKLDADTASTASARAEREAWQRRLRATAADFEKDDFSAASYLDPDVVKTTVERVRRVVAFLKVVVPELDDKQRKLASQNLRAEVGVTHE